MTDEHELALPESLRLAIEADMAPVRPLAAPWKRTLYVLPVAAAMMGMPFVYANLRDTGELGMMLAWVPVALQVLLAFALLAFALREGVPGWRGSTAAIFAVCAGAFALQVLANVLIFWRAPAGEAGPVQSLWMHCFSVESLIGVPILLGIAWLVARSLPQRPLLAGFLAGTGAGLAGDASWRMICPYSDMPHVLLGHTGGILVLGAAGLALGYLWQRSSSR